MNSQLVHHPPPGRAPCIFCSLTQRACYPSLLSPLPCYPALCFHGLQHSSNTSYPTTSLHHDKTIVLQLHHKPLIPLVCSPCFRAQAIWRATPLCWFPSKGMRVFPKLSSLNHILFHVHTHWVAPSCPVLLCMRSWLSPSLWPHCLSTHQPLPHLVMNHHFSPPSFLF